MNIHSLTSQPSDERSFLGNNSLTPGAAGRFHGAFGGLSNVHSMPVPSRSISPGSSFGGGSIAGSAVSDVPPLLPLFPIHKPRDPTMPWNPDQAAAARQQMRPFDSRAAYSEGVPQRSTGWSIASPHPLSQSHNDSRFGGGRFDPTREDSRSPTSDPMGKKQKTEGLLSEGLRKESYSHSQPRDNYDDQMLRKIATGKLVRDGSNLSTTSVGSPRSALSAGLASFPNQPSKPTNGLPIPFGSSPSNPLQPWQGDRSNPQSTQMAFRPTEFPPVFPPAITGAPPRSHRVQRSFEHDRMSIGGNDQDYCNENGSRRGSRSRSSQGYDDGDDLQMDGIPPSHVSNRMEGLTLENPTPPRTPSSVSGQRQQRGAKRRASSPSEGSGSNNRRSPVGGYTPRLSPNGSMRSQGPGAFSSASRGPGSSISTSTSSTNTGWSSYPSNVSIPSAASSIHNDHTQSVVHAHPIPSSQVPPTEQHFTIESKSLTPRSFVTVREREIQPAKPENSELVAPTRPGRFNGFSYICDCCPKKPKKFESQAELEQHESEKQHKCQYCDNKFKNKNEAERHQNSLHLRKHSWSCAALTSYEDAFHRSKTDLADICGYCGQEFPVPANWESRMLHLTSDHKFGECNQAKKFFRADHFRQHLKHSHSGTSGKWTNLLETACMRDEGRIDAPMMPMDR